MKRIQIGNLFKCHQIPVPKFSRIFFKEVIYPYRSFPAFHRNEWLLQKKIDPY